MLLKINANVSNFVKKTDYNTNVNEIQKRITSHDHSKYITTQAFNKLTSEIFASILAQANLANRNDIADLVKKTEFDDKLKKEKKMLLQTKQNICFLKISQMNYKRTNQRWMDIRRI